MHRAELEAFYRALCAPLARRLRWRHGLSEEDADDLVQDTFVLALTRIRSDGNPGAWLVRVIDRLASNLTATRIRRARLLARWGPEVRLDGSDKGDDA